jgi:hypothetical protein
MSAEATGVPLTKADTRIHITRRDGDVRQGECERRRNLI